MPHHSRNSFVPNWFVSSEFQARSSTTGRCAFGPTPSSQLYPRDEIATRIANDRYAEVLDLARDVGAESFCIGEARPRLVHARVDGPAQVLEERAEHAPVEVAPARRSTKKHPRGAGTCLRVTYRRQPGSRDGDACGAAEARQKSPAIACSHRHTFRLVEVLPQVAHWFSRPGRD